MPRTTLDWKLPLISSNPTINPAFPSPPPNDVCKYHIYIFFQLSQWQYLLISSELWLSSESLVFTENVFCFSKEAKFCWGSSIEVLTFAISHVAWNTLHVILFVKKVFKPVQIFLINVDDFTTGRWYKECLNNKNICFDYSLLCTSHQGEDFILEAIMTTYYKTDTVIIWEVM